MAITASEARKKLFPLIDQVNDDQEPVEIVSRRGSAYLVSESQFRSLLETAYLLRSPANASRLLESIASLEQGAGQLRELVDVGDGDLEGDHVEAAGDGAARVPDVGFDEDEPAKPAKAPARRAVKKTAGGRFEAVPGASAKKVAAGTTTVRKPPSHLPTAAKAAPAKAAPAKAAPAKSAKTPAKGATPKPGRG